MHGDAIHGDAIHGGASPNGVVNHDDIILQEGNEDIDIQDDSGEGVKEGIKEDNPESKPSALSRLAKASGKLASGIIKAPGNIIKSTKKAITGVKKAITGTTEEDKKRNKLAQKISESIQKSFAIIKLKEQLREIDLQKIAKLIIEKPVNLNFGGGFLVFGPDLKISSMIHIFNKNSEPFYFEKQFSSSIEPNTINEAIKSDKKYDIKQIIQSIQQINKPKTS
jgi:hypothetical protein